MGIRHTKSRLTSHRPKIQPIMSTDVSYLLVKRVERADDEVLGSEHFEDDNLILLVRLACVCIFVSNTLCYIDTRWVSR